MTKKELEIKKMYQDFPITSVCRVDIIDKFGKKTALGLTDDDMKEIASKMANAYCDNVFWIDLDIIVRNILEEKEND